MKNLLTMILLISFNVLFSQYPDGTEILTKIDENMYSKSIVAIIQMTVHGNRISKTMKLKSWSEGEKRSFSEYLYPPRDAGTKMLKLDNNLWIYDPAADRTIQISGHMLRQSVMGSDLSYEDMMEENQLKKVYDAVVLGEDSFSERKCWVLELKARKSDLAYQTKKIWVDQERYLPLKEERFGKSGILLKTTEINEIIRLHNRWYPQKITVKDALKDGKGTEIMFEEIEFDAEIPAARFSKAALRK